MANPNVSDYISSLGIDPDTVRVDGFDQRGYYVNLPADTSDPTGLALTISGRPVREWRRWPKEFNWDLFLEAIRADYRAARDAVAAELDA